MSDATTTTRVSKDGQVTVTPGKAAPKLLDPTLRKMPGSWVTDEVAEDGKLHELDDPHTVLAVAEEISNKERGIETEVQRLDREREEAKAPAVSKDPREHKLTQWRIDVVRLRVLRTVIRRMRSQAERGVEIDWATQHLWFPRDDDREYELRAGNPPSDLDRPKHLRRWRLAIDALSGALPRTIADKLPKEAYDEYQRHLASLRPTNKPKMVYL